MIDSVAAEELETLRKKHKHLLEENNELSIKVQAGEKARLSYESTLSSLKETVNQQKAEIVDLYAKCAELESVKIQFDREAEKCTAKDAEVTRLRAESVEMQADMTACRSKEAELLDFTQKLTDKNVILQSEFSNMQVRANTLEEEHTRLVTSLAKAETRITELQTELSSSTGNLSEQVSSLTAELRAKTGEALQAVEAAVDAKNEVEVMKRQHTARVRELTKELNATKKRGGDREPSPGVLSQGSRSSSSASLHNKEALSPGLLKASSPSLRPLAVTTSSPTTAAAGSPAVSPRNNGVEHHSRKISSDMNRNQFDSGSGGPDSQMLIEKIVKLQRACARRQEKLDFLEEHVEQLVGEVKKKNKIIQNYVLSLQPGALVSEQSDIHKHTLNILLNDEAVIGQQGGIMSSVYGSKVTDSGMTFELSLEMNKKLQAVLEETLLKNITLKENMNTLGTEIAKISMERQASK